MKNRVLKFCSYVLVILIVIAGVPFSVSAESLTDYTYTVTADNTIKITGYLGNSALVDIPSQIDGKNVTIVGSDSFTANSTLTTLTIPQTVTAIESGAFYNCPSLSSVTFSTGVVDIGTSAFRQCPLLTQIVIPDSVLNIGGRAFCDCTNLSNIDFADTTVNIGYRAFYGTAWYSSQPDGLVYAGNVAYEYKGSMSADTTVTFKDGTLSITDEAFYARSSLVGIVIPDSLKVINYAAFSWCENLASVNMGNSIESIGSYAFNKCGKLTAITIPDTIKEIGDSAFALCSNLVIYSVANGYAYDYAIKNSITFSEIVNTVLYGDVNSDKIVNSKDVLRLKQFLADWDVTIDMDAANVNGDTLVNAKDVLRLKQYLADWDVVLGK